MAKPTTPAYDAVNAQPNKQPVIVMTIEGLPYAFASAQTYTKIRYDDPGVNYDGQFVYDGLRPLSTGVMKNYIDRAGSSANISQKLEQWDGKASVETVSIRLVDVNGEISKLIAPGIVLPEILNQNIKIYYGFQNISYPEDFIRIFSGFVNETDTQQGAIVFNLTDPSSKRKQAIFNAAFTTLSADIDDNPATTTIPVVSNTELYANITDPFGGIDPSITLGVIIGDEIITYTNAGIDPGGVQLINTTRGAFGSTIETHSAGDEVDCFIQLVDNPVNIALKVMLSGWDGPCFDTMPLRGVLNEDNGLVIPDSITFPIAVDLIRDFGVSEGDFILLESSPISGNNRWFTIESFDNSNRTVIVAEKGILSEEDPPSSGNLATTAAIRSQYDTYPITAGLQLTTDDVDVASHEYLRDTFISFNYTIQEKGEEDNGKTWIETNIFKPIAAYSLVQGSRIAMGLTRPPLSSDLTKIIDHTNVINAQNIVVTRGLNNRMFYNEVQFNFNWDIIQGEFLNQFIVEDATSQNRMGQVSSLSIDALGLPAGSENIMRALAQRILLRYRYAAETITLETNFGTGHTIDGGDVVVLTDQVVNGQKVPILQIPNSEDGTRGVYDRIMEVQERTIQLSNGKTSLTLLSNNGFFLTDRYAVISPASTVLNGISTSRFQVQDSYGALYPAREYLKWTNYQGLAIHVHSPDYTRHGKSNFMLDASNPYIFNLASPLSFIPQAGDIVEFARYDETLAASQAPLKSRYTFVSRTGIVSTGSSANVFTLTSGQGANYTVGATVLVTSPDYSSRVSPEVKITSVVGDVITIGEISAGSETDLGFTPQAGDLMRLGGFKDAGQSYRYS